MTGGGGGGGEMGEARGAMPVLPLHLLSNVNGSQTFS